MCKENCTEINLSSSVFNEMRDNFDAILKKALGNIVKGKSGQADINLKLTISATGENEGQLKPKFKHQVSSVMAIKERESGMRNVSVDAEELIAAIKRVGYAVSLNPNRPAMTGIYFKAENGKLNLVGCDGSQLAKVEFPYEEDFHFILPNETAKSLAALDLHGQCQITGDHKKAVFSTEDYTLTTSLICGEYMNYESVIPKAGKYDVVFDRDSLLGAATRVKNLMDLKHREPVVLHIDGESCYITSRLTGVEFHEDVLCQGTIPEPMNIAFDDILLLNGISATKGEGIRALLNSSLSPMKIENEGFTALVLPVRMKNRA